jgi:hypothetical protein
MVMVFWSDQYRSWVFLRFTLFSVAYSSLAEELVVGQTNWALRDDVSIVVGLSDSVTLQACNLKSHLHPPACDLVNRWPTADFKWEALE